MSELKAPFPWWGGKSRVAHLVWDRFGDVPNYCEPFFGSGAVLLSRPHLPKTETVNDKDCMVANFWRALQHEPEAVAEFADNPVNEADQHARHLWLCSQEEFRERMKTEPDYYDTKVAGWWVWGQCIWIGSGWCSRKLPHLGDAGKGVHRQLPHLGDAGEEAFIASDLTSGTRVRAHLLEYMRELAERLRNVRVCCGDWSRICGPSPTIKHGITGVFLDPPYTTEANRTDDLYATDDLDVGRAVAAWAQGWGSHPKMRIALCGYEGEYGLPGWTEVAWKTLGGYGSQGDGRGRANAKRETIWFSPHCLKQGLFEQEEELVHD